MMWDKIFIALFSAAVAWFLQQYRIARSEDIVLINEHIKDLEKFSETAQAYWLLKPKKPEDDLAAAAKVRAAHAATTLLYSDICRICPQASASYTERSE